jgi:hypothetical protein
LASDEVAYVKMKEIYSQVVNKEPIESMGYPFWWISLANASFANSIRFFRDLGPSVNLAEFRQQHPYLRDWKQYLESVLKSEFLEKC